MAREFEEREQLPQRELCDGLEYYEMIKSKDLRSSFAWLFSTIAVLVGAWALFLWSLGSRALAGLFSAASVSIAPSTNVKVGVRLKLTLSFSPTEISCLLVTLRLLNPSVEALTNLPRLAQYSSTWNFFSFVLVSSLISLTD